MGIFDKRVSYKPFEYPDVLGYVDAINAAYWLFTEFNFTSDIQDFKVRLDDVERSAVKNAILAISQIEVDVKTFWGNLHQRIPKPEFNDVGMTFGENEVRHSRAYAHLLEILSLNADFENLLEVPAIKGRIGYLNKHIGSRDNFVKSLILFTLLIENVSLFSQFAIVRSFQHNKNVLKGVDNVIQATMLEEEIHGQFGAALVNIIREEHPEMFTEEIEESIRQACYQAYEAECKVLDWIFEAGELEFLSIATVKEFIKYRFNDSLEMINFKPMFEVDHEVLKPLEWFIDEIVVSTQHDFFNKRPTSYTKRTQAISGDDLF